MELCPVGISALQRRYGWGGSWTNGWMALLLVVSALLFVYRVNEFLSYYANCDIAMI